MAKSKRPIKKASTPRRITREAEILRAAREVFGAVGFDNASISEIAAKSNVVEGTIYLYFENKNHLMQRVIAEWYEGLIADISVGVKRFSGTRAKLRYLIWRHLRVYIEDSGLANLLIRELRRERSFYDSEIRALNRRYTSFVIDTVADAIKQGEFKSTASPQIIRDLIFGGLEHMAWRAISGQGAIDIDAVADQMLDSIWFGAAPRSEHDEASLEERIARLERAILKK